MWLGRMVDLGSRMIGLGTITSLGNSNLDSRVDSASRVESKSKNWNSHSSPINGMWLSKVGDSISRFMGTEINVGSEIGPNWVRIPESNRFEDGNWITKLGIEFTFIIKFNLIKMKTC